MTETGLGVQSNKRPGAYARMAAAAEALGFDVVSVYGDLLYQPPLPALLEMAGATTTVRLGPACLNPYTMHPYEIAGQVAALDMASDGRAYLGLARGAWLPTIGIFQDDAPQRLREAIAIVRVLLAGDDSGFAGEVFRVAPGTTLLYETLRDRVPVLIGAWGAATLATARQIADEVKIGGSANPAMVAIARERVGNPDVGVAMGAVCVVDDDGQAARALARREVAMYLDVVAGLDPTIDVDPEMMSRLRAALGQGDVAAAASVIPDAVLDAFAFSGTPGQVADQASRLLEAGADRIEFGTPHGLDPLRGVELLGTEVLPRL